jgi:hypothetical protein
MIAVTFVFLNALLCEMNLVHAVVVSNLFSHCSEIWNHFFKFFLAVHHFANSYVVNQL